MFPVLDRVTGNGWSACVRHTLRLTATALLLLGCLLPQSATAQAAVVQDISYSYSDSGLITGIADNKNSCNWTYQYDDVYRLSGARRGDGIVLGGGTEIYNKAYAYNNIGNITSFEGAAYTYADASHKHAVTAAGGNTYTYDANGNMLTGANRAITWNSENKPAAITKNGVETTFVYGTAGERVKKETGEDFKIYVGGIFEKDQDGNVTCYIEAVGTTVKKNTDGSLSFILKDHLGGTSIITDEQGNAVTQQYYEPYGKDDAAGSFENETDDHKFTGQEEDTETGLYYYGARYYDPALGRFISADPVQGMNRYAYCGNNPVNAIDPSGLVTIRNTEDGAWSFGDEFGNSFVTDDFNEIWGGWINTEVERGILSSSVAPFYTQEPSSMLLEEMWFELDNESMHAIGKAYQREYLAALDREKIAYTKFTLSYDLDWYSENMKNMRFYTECAALIINPEALFTRSLAKGALALGSEEVSIGLSSMGKNVFFTGGIVGFATYLDNGGDEVHAIMKGVDNAVKTRTIGEVANAVTALAGPYVGGLGISAEYASYMVSNTCYYIGKVVRDVSQGKSLQDAAAAHLENFLWGFVYGRVVKGNGKTPAENAAEFGAVPGNANFAIYQVTNATAIVSCINFVIDAQAVGDHGYEMVGMHKYPTGSGR